MKTLVSVLVISAVALSGCARQDTRTATADSDVEPSGVTTQPAGDPGVVGTADTTISTRVDSSWNELSTYSYDRRGEFNSSLNAMSARVDAEISELRADISGEQASASRRAALEEIESAKSDFDDKSAALARASEDTWDQARDEANAAWERLQAAIARARNEN